MNERLYEMMDWARIEGLVYSEENQPHDFLGAHQTKDGVLIQTFIPTAVKVEVILEGTKKHIEMEEEDEAGFFAALLPRKSIPKYKLEVTFDDGSVQELYDPYSFEPQITRKMTEKFNKGISYDIYEKLGAHPMTVDGVDGIYFAVWAPNALRVSLVGDFNLWDGRRLPMRRLWDSGIFEIFIPDLPLGSLYKYEIKAQNGLTFLKADPFGNAAESAPNEASIVTDLTGFAWTDEKWLAARRAQDIASAPMAVYEVHLGSWKKPEDGNLVFGYKELAKELAEYVKKMGYTHIELLPVMEHTKEEEPDQIISYFAPTGRYGTPQEFMYFMNYMHEQGIGVILDWDASHFPKDIAGLGGFDGTCLYEHKDPRQGQHPTKDAYLFNYGRPEVSNYLIANALFWTKVYHADGLKMNAVSSMLYLDYGKNAGEWVANIYGGNENLEAVEFIKHLNSIYHKLGDGALMIAEEEMAWPKVTGDLDDEGLGFDLKWNNGWKSDLLGYMELDPIFRSYHHGDLTFSMIYHYSENFMLALSHEDVSEGKGTLIRKMPGREKYKFANLRALYGFMFTHPGKKLLFMAQDFGQFDEWAADRYVEWDLLGEPEHAQMQSYMRELLKVYRENPALYALDDEPEGFDWINDISANENMIVFLRKTQKEDEDLLVVCNFSNVPYADHKIGVPFAGKYKEIFNSDREEFGGSGNINPRVKNAKKDECDGREDSIRVMVPPLGVSIFKCTRSVVKTSANEEAKKKKAVAKTKETSKENLREKLEKKVYEEEKGI